MLEKYQILILILSLLLSFYLVIRWGAGKKKGSAISPEITNYLFGVRILIIIIGIISVVFWLIF